MKNFLKISSAAVVVFSASVAYAQSGSTSDVSGPAPGSVVTFAPLPVASTPSSGVGERHAGNVVRADHGGGERIQQLRRQRPGQLLCRRNASRAVPRGACGAGANGERDQVVGFPG